MSIKNFELIDKKALTKDVYELTFFNEEKLDNLPGQFITILLPELGGRAYSILDTIENITNLIIKKVENGRGGSKFICDSEIGTIFKGVGPTGHFILRENEKNKLFIGTGTGFVPLYNQIMGAIKKGLNANLKLIFGVRTYLDIFYLDELNKLKNENGNFDFEIYLSRQDLEGFNKGYTSDFIVKENIDNFEEFYICGMPDMIDSCVEKLKNLGISEYDILTEKY